MNKRQKPAAGFKMEQKYDRDPSREEIWHISNPRFRR
jgi:hypothetical protein